MPGASAIGHENDQLSLSSPVRGWTFSNRFTGKIVVLWPIPSISHIIMLFVGNAVAQGL